MNKSGRIATLLVALVAFVVAVGGVVAYLVAYPPTASATPSAGSPPSADITLQTVPVYGLAPEPTWVSYMVKQGDTWVHSTVFQVPAHSLVHFTVYQYDTGSPLRNPFLDQTQGLVGGTENVDGKDVSVVNADEGDGIGHSFTIPALGVHAVFPGISGDAKNPCPGPAPCADSFDHHTITFTIQTGDPGTYTWQCFVPCALGYPLGFGGPMSTFGYMNGYLKVVA